ncbi:hypothetical protein [Variovorax paradoxus]|uniref:hypothetical protein n=1 Tax=Variovorax paradoxus TaxID=34073 RepID=UPI002478D8E9
MLSINARRMGAGGVCASAAKGLAHSDSAANFKAWRRSKKLEFIDLKRAPLGLDEVSSGTQD